MADHTSDHEEEIVERVEAGFIVAGITEIATKLTDAMKMIEVLSIEAKATNSRVAKLEKALKSKNSKGFQP